MADRSIPFRWWYLLLLLPVLLYFGARWYVGYRIEEAIEAANEGENSLALADYSFGFFPIEASVRGLTFDQTLDALQTTGRLSQGTVSGLNLWSLFGDDPIAVNRITLQGFDVKLVRTGLRDRQGRKSNFALEVGDVNLDSVFLEIDDRAGSRHLTVANLDLAMQTFQLPFRPTQISNLSLSADSSLYRNYQDSMSVLATDIGYDTNAEAILVSEVRYQRSDSTDVRAGKVRLTGLNGQDLDGTLSIDSLSIATLGGGARVQGKRQEASDSGESTPIRLGKLSLPDVDLNVSGAFGTIRFAGELTADELQYQDSFSLQSARLSGQTVTYHRGTDLAIETTGARIEQGPLTFPLKNGLPGLTSIDIPDFKLTTDGQSINLTALAYRSDSATVTANQLELDGSKVNGSIASLRITGLDRNALLAGEPLTIPVAVLTDSRLNVRQQSGANYQLDIPTVEFNDLVRNDGLRVERTRISNATVTRRTASGKEDLVARGIYVDQRGVSTPFSAKNLGKSTLRASEVRMIGDREPIDYHYSNLAYNSRAGTLSLDSLNRINRLSPGEVFSQKISKSWLSFSFDGIHAEGIDHGALVAGKLIQVDSLSARDFRLRVVEDVSLELPSKEKLMPIEALRSIGPRIVLNRAQLSSTDIAYGVVDSVLQPKTIHFNSGTVRFSGLDTEISTTDSLLVSLDATFEQTTPLHAEFALSRDSSGRNYAVRGQMGSYDLSRINPLMEVAANAVVETGVIDSLSYHGRLQDEVLTGQMTLLYHNLDLKIVGSGAWIKNLLSGVVMKDSNLPGEDFRQGQMYHEHPSTKSFFNAYWKGLVSGMKSSALSDIALQKELD
ncbi:hypothetical protein GGR28_001326 [Lewinella aquimaris]|uniref:DUF748 domain-containing protein n=1 Tax=Neolewinella aquimaris TaxID=1835722 RepID=A0A840E435_9BACT|nr:hypothetical protein [Neolewinella aquimaris]MBB4078713.1 hypothetical protein [Neolewinella aquimaris]